VSSVTTTTRVGVWFGDVGVIVKAAFVKRDPRAVIGAPPGSLYRPTLSARMGGFARAAGQQTGAAIFSALVTSLVVMIAVSRNPSLPEDYEPSEAPNTTLAYRQSEPGLDFADRWGDLDAGEVTPVEDFVTGSLTKTVRTISFARPVQEASRPRPAPGFALASIDPRPVEIDKPKITGKDIAIDLKDDVSRYLWEVYQRSPTKKDGSGDFTWKDPAAAERVSMSLPKYVILGMDPDFREQLYHAGRAMDAAGVQWSILSAFRDDYRQRIASGIKASGGNSLHGGSRRTGGYGHGQAVDVAGGEGTEMSDVWKWIDAHGAKYGLYRPMPGYDPAHIQSRGDWRKLAASLRQVRIKEAQMRPAVSEAPKTGDKSDDKTDAKANVVAAAAAQ
jgi:hypothetical protein